MQPQRCPASGDPGPAHRAADRKSPDGPRLRTPCARVPLPGGDIHRRGVDHRRRAVHPHLAAAGGNGHLHVHGSISTAV